jgi:hypothetical protein
MSGLNQLQKYKIKNGLFGGRLYFCGNNVYDFFGACSEIK